MSECPLPGVLEAAPIVQHAQSPCVIPDVMGKRTLPLHGLSGGCLVDLRREPGSSHDLMMKLLENANG